MHESFGVFSCDTGVSTYVSEIQYLLVYMEAKSFIQERKIRYTYLN